MIRCIVSYYPTTNKIHNIYNSVEEAKKDVKLCNLFSKGHEKLSIAIAELTDKEYREKSIESIVESSLEGWE